VGTISSPIVFQKEDGKRAVRIIYFKSEIKPHQANLDEDWQKIQLAASNEKKSNILNEWFDKARFDVFINIDETYNYCNILK